ncbi:MAG: hypothetical protein H7336_01345 [Bacteriovorax sp.]|nr:hypothetical protein [Bacteriovorax sp.]
MNDLIFTHSDYLEFRNWLNLNLDGLTWQERIKKEFETFWEVFFEENLTVRKLIVRFDYAYSQVRIGSLSSWFLWLRDKFLSFIFLFKNKTIGELAEESEMSPSLLATILRNYLLDEFPHLDQYFSDVFQVGNVLSPNLQTSYAKIQLALNIPTPQIGSKEDEIMPSMEVTLFDEWGIFLKKMKADFQTNSFDLEKIKERSSFLKQVRVVQDISILLLLFTLTIYGVRQGNIWYERYLANKVSIYEPQFTWLNKNGVFKGFEKKPVKEYKLDFDGIKDISKSSEVNEFFDPNTYEEETDVTDSSFEDIPKDFNKADKVRSKFEGDAENANGYRETTGGTTKTYRLMMTSTNTYATRDQINELVKKYQGSAVKDSVPGADVPGGVYYNIYIPQASFKEFMSETMKVNQSKLMESNTSNVKNVQGKTRVFIMVKSI